MQQTITPDKQTVEVCLKNKSYYIDFYQREYVWTKETVEILLKDIFYSFELSYEQYKDAELSPEVIEKFNWYYLNIYITNNMSEKVWENMFYLDIWISPCKFTIQRKSVFSALNPAECAIF